MVKIMFQCALDFELDYTLHEDSDLEVEGIMNAIGKELIKEHLELIHRTFNQLPFNATRSVRSLLDFIGQQPKLECSWMAQQLKMGLWLTNQIGRLAWYVLFASILYTWEIVAKHRKPEVEAISNIYYRDTPSLGRGAVTKEEQLYESRVEFRDQEFKAPETGGYDNNYWYSVLWHIAYHLPKKREDC